MYKSEVGAVMEKLRKACVLDKKYSKKSYAKISTLAPKSKFIIKLKSFG